MAQTTLEAILRGIREVLLTPATIDIVQLAGEGDIEEGVAETPTIQVYPTEGDSQTFTFSARVQSHDLTVTVDIYVSERANIGEDLQNVVRIADEMIDVLQDEQEKGTTASPLFDLVDTTDGPIIKNLNWRWEFVSFEYANIRYVGIRFVLELMIY